MNNIERVFLFGYWHHNLGDDLFLKIISERYPQCRFFISSNDDYRGFSSNLQNKGNRIINKLIRVVTHEKWDYSMLCSMTFKTIVYLGGSLFIESELPYEKHHSKQSEYYVIGANFGPYFSDEYLKYHERFFLGAKDICFRDKISLQLFSKADHFRLAPDVVFGLKTDEKVDSHKKNVVFSLIDTSKRKDVDTLQYEKGIVKLIRDFADRGYQIKLISFCKFEGDEAVISRIMDMCPDVDICPYFYRKDIEKALDVLKNSEVIVGARYHSIILGILFQKYTVPLVYSDKLINELTYINYEGQYLDLRTDNWYEQFQMDSLYRYEAQKLPELISAAECQFQALDHLLEK